MMALRTTAGAVRRSVATTPLGRAATVVPPRHAPRAPPALLRRRLSTGPPKKPDSFGTKKKGDENLTREEVDRLAEHAKAEQKLWNAMIPEQNMSAPFLVAMAVAAVGLHYYNGNRREQLEAEEAAEAELLLKATQRNRERRKELESLETTGYTAAASTPENISPELRRELQSRLEFKRKQLAEWETKKREARRSGDDGRRQLADDRISELQGAIHALQFRTG